MILINMLEHGLMNMRKENNVKICPDCGYFNEEKYDEYSPYPGECEDCYRYEICLEAEIKEG